MHRRWVSNISWVAGLQGVQIHRRPEWRNPRVLEMFLVLKEFTEQKAGDQFDPLEG